MKGHRSLTALALGVALLAPACAGTRVYGGRVAYGRVYSSYDEGFRRGLNDGRWAAYRDFGKPYRRNFSNDSQYRRGTEGYRREYGSRAVYADGYRAGYERGYLERRDQERDRRR